ncbi:MAG: acetate--CoA ligase family protein [Candidatus Brocadiaceae bacterium]|nr:acetate--CoA ligase family protein [Candidatus Brocadiaceae bacterium]
MSKAIDITYSIIKKALLQKRNALLDTEAKELIGQFGIVSPKHVLTTSFSDAEKAALSIGYPVALKIVSPDIIHKTDAGGVMLNIHNEEELHVSYDKILSVVKNKARNAEIYGVLLEKMEMPSTEVIIGGIRDPQFGPAVMFGMGGVFVEIFNDISFRIAPVEEYEAIDMIHEVKGVKLLCGFRNIEALDISTVAKTIMQVSEIMITIEEINEIDLNPVFVYPKGVKAVDARIILRKS